MKPKEAAGEFMEEYLQNRYSSEFEIISLNRENAPGEKIPNYVALFHSSSHDRRNFYVSCSKKDEFSINIDEYPSILLEEAFLENLDIKIYRDFPLVFELQSKLLLDINLDNVNNINDAKTKLSSLGSSSWNFYIYTIVAEPEKRIIEIEDMVINLFRQAYKILPARITASVYIYEDDSLTEKDIQPDMNEGIVNRTPHKDKLYEEWLMGWNQKMLDSYSNSFQSVVKRREVIPN